MSKLTTINASSLSTVTGGDGVVSTVLDTPSRFLDGYNYGRNFIGPIHDMSPTGSRIEGVLDGVYDVFRPGSERALLGKYIRRGKL